METFFNIAIPLSVGAVALALGLGIYSLYRGGDFARSNSNKLMRLRVVLQAVAILLLLTGLWWKATHGA